MNPLTNNKNKNFNMLLIELLKKTKNLIYWSLDRR